MDKKLKFTTTPIVGKAIQLGSSKATLDLQWSRHQRSLVVTPAYYWFLSIYSNRPDGGTLMMLQHHRKLIKSGKKSFIVYDNVKDLIWWRGPVPRVITAWQAMKLLKEGDFLISSWDQHILRTFKNIRFGRKIAYLQSHFANHRQSYNTDFQIVTVSNFAKDYIKTRYGKESKVLPNVVRIPNEVRPLPFQQKKDCVVTGLAKRDRDIFKKFYYLNSPNIPIIILPQWKSRIDFLNLVNNRKYYLSFYKDDAFGLPPIQAMAMGTVPIIISNSTGKDYRNALNSVCRDVQSYMRRIDGIDFKKLQPVRKKMSLNGPPTARQYRQSKIMEVII